MQQAELVNFNPLIIHANYRQTDFLWSLMPISTLFQLYIAEASASIHAFREVAQYSFCATDLFLYNHLGSNVQP